MGKRYIIVLMARIQGDEGPLIYFGEKHTAFLEDSLATAIKMLKAHSVPLRNSTSRDRVHVRKRPVLECSGKHCSLHSISKTWKQPTCPSVGELW